MRIASILATAAIVVTCGSVSVQAQSSTKAVPAEFPPASFTGRQYVDSKGCVFIRAGIDGAVTWVPRMTRARKQICGVQPSLSSAQVAAVQAPRATAEPPAAAPPAAAPRRAAAAQPAPAPVRARRPVAAATPAAPPAAPPAASADAPPRVRTVTVAVPAADAPPRRVAEVACTGASPLSQNYVGTGRNVRCGPQSTPHVTEIASASAGATIYDPARLRPAGPHLSAAYGATPVRVAPKHVYANQKASTAGIYVPPGYVPVWEDDRLNPRRAHQTLTGKAQMDSTWTRTVPRRLIPADPGPVVARGNSRLYHVTRATPAPAGAAVVSTRGTPPAQAAEVTATPASHRYVQLGAFADPAHARRTAQKIANSGLPARMGGVTRDGKSYTLVLAGPFETQQGLERGLQQVRGMGFDRAVLRR